ncbi:hypothetical protein AAG906_033139 [Vitis piasezkii]
MATNMMDVAPTMGLANPITTRNVTRCVVNFVNKWAIPQINCVTSSNGKNKTWLMDSATSHNITGDLANLSIHNEYDGTDEVILGDGSACENGVYIFPESMMSPTSKMVANVHEWTSIDGWNKRLGHPSL